MGKFWSLLFLCVPVLGTMLYLAGMFSSSGPLAMWFPENINSLATDIDLLHDVILALISVVFIGTGLAIFLFMWKYDCDCNPEAAKFVHGNHRLELWWTIIPTIILVALAIYQFKVYADVRIHRPMMSGSDGLMGTADDVPEPASFEVMGRQFEWRIRYAGDDGLLDTPDDIMGEINELHAPIGQTMVGSLKSADVLHSFFIPALRIKNDIIPGSRQIVWFRAEKAGTFDIVCAELCGWGHYKMKGRFVSESAQSFQKYLAGLRETQFMRKYSPDEADPPKLADANP